ncbi:uncharacterized protein LOC141512221 [Macrotis lagotis]|uniref:uncharacterized protein LOC141512221 n=1 Tax=Macrotis lagotis TaxID=92651 RepID=UPI003D698919
MCVRVRVGGGGGWHHPTRAHTPPPAEADASRSRLPGRPPPPPLPPPLQRAQREPPPAATAPRGPGRGAQGAAPPPGGPRELAKARGAWASSARPCQRRAAPASSSGSLHGLPGEVLLHRLSCTPAPPPQVECMLLEDSDYFLPLFLCHHKAVGLCLAQDHRAKYRREDGRCQPHFRLLKKKTGKKSTKEELIGSITSLSIAWLNWENFSRTLSVSVPLSFILSYCTTSGTIYSLSYIFTYVHILLFLFSYQIG